MTLDEYIQKLIELRDQIGGQHPVIVAQGGCLEEYVGLATEPVALDFLPTADKIDPDLLPLSNSEKFVIV